MAPRNSSPSAVWMSGCAAAMVRREVPAPRACAPSPHLLVVHLALILVGEITTVACATLALYGRSYATGAGGSFNWLSFSDAGETPRDFVSNAAPYRWYRAGLGAAIAAGDAKVLLRIKAGPSSGALVVNRIEICMSAQ